MSIPATGVVLAGGLSSRFGSDKALAPWKGGRLIERAAGLLLETFPSVLVLAKTPERYAFLRRAGLRLLADRAARLHPLAGLCCALEQAGTRHIFARGCDMPFLSRGLLRRLWRESPGCEAVVPVWSGKPQPLCAFYSKGCVAAMLELLARERPLRELFERVRTRLLDETAVRLEDPDGLSFMDLDTVEEYEKAVTARVPLQRNRRPPRGGGRREFAPPAGGRIFSWGG